MGFGGLSRYPLLAFLIACFMVYFIITRYKRDRKSFIAMYLIVALGCLLVTLRRLNGIYFSLSQSKILLIDIIIYTCLILLIILSGYCAFTNKENPNARKMAYIGTYFIGFAVILSLLLIILKLIGIL